MSKSVRKRKIMRKIHYALAYLIANLAIPAFAAATPPGQAESGFGSTQHYISSAHSAFVTGSRFDGTKVSWFVPDVLKNKASAPVVVLLHGKFFVDPAMYNGLIAHLTRQGYIVIFPQYEKETVGGVVAASHIDMMNKAITATRQTLDKLGSQADRNNLYVFGHSLGGLLAACWTGSDGPAPKGIMLAMPFIRDSTGQVPVQPTPLPYASLIPKTTAPVLLVSGTSDKLTGTAQAREIYSLMSANSVAFHEAQSDAHGQPALEAIHMTPTQSSGALPALFWKTAADGAPTLDTLDYRVIFAGIDAVLGGQISTPFDMGQWSDGQPVSPVKLLDLKWK